MKRSRFFCAAVAIALLMTLSAAALAEYTHPSDYYGFPLPEGWEPTAQASINLSLAEGWYAISHSIATSYVEKGVLNAATRDAWFHTEHKLAAVLLETGHEADLFKNNIRIFLYDVDSSHTAKTYAAAYSGEHEARVKGAHPKAVIVTPLQAVTFGGRQAAVFAYSVSESDGSQIAVMDVALFLGSNAARLFVVCTAADASRCGAVLEQIASSFTIN